ncbi:hypothetical protein QQP08_007024 [Theobroma cacao]|nr:hypothetical protein QQP08_007024 [Theobroma cacao]
MIYDDEVWALLPVSSNCVAYYLIRLLFVAGVVAVEERQSCHVESDLLPPTNLFNAHRLLI